MVLRDYDFSRARKFSNRDFYRRLCLLGAKNGLSVYVFFPNGVDWEKHAVTGYSYDDRANTWRRGRFPLPDLVYDRCFFSNRRQYREYREQMRRFRACKAVLFLGYGLKGKWDVYQMLLREKELQHYLPETVPLTGRKSLVSWFQKRHDACLKPQGGTHGKGVLHAHCNRSTGLYTVKGRDHNNGTICRTFDSFLAFLQWIETFTAGRKYLVQRYLMLTTAEGDVFDIRSLVQKDANGHWQLTGMAVRRGQHGSFTSNLHGGGTVEEVKPFLIRQFGVSKAADILAELERLSRKLPFVLERRHGRLAELGLDLGVDIHGRIWVLEANSRPGRSVFAKIHNREARRNSLANPIRYAVFLLKKSLNEASTRNLFTKKLSCF
jgi:glutathione synthase/RimK-type ligase-like ATP-grasp enzyme